MDIFYLKPQELIPYERNAKKHPEDQVEHIANSIKEFGFKQPIVVDKENVVIIGHGRLLAAKKLGLETVPVVKADDLTEAQVAALRLADNKTNESEWDLDLLSAELDGIFDIDMSAFGFDLQEEEEPAEVVEDEVPEEVETRCKLGDLWKLGNHRLICGDSTEGAVIERLVDGEEVDLFLTDPPYNVDYEGSNGKKIENDNLDDLRFRQLLVDAFLQANERMKPGAPFYIWHADSEGYNFRAAAKETGWKVRQCLIWNKNSFVLGRQDYQWKHEPCLYGWKDGAAHYFIDDRAQATVIADETEIDPRKMKKSELIEIVEAMLADRISTTVINEDKPSKNAEHPTMKPIKLLARLIRNSSRQGDLVLDSFGGSGSTLITCQQLNRKCYMAELDPHYCDVILQRWENFTGQKAELIK